MRRTLLCVIAALVVFGTSGAVAAPNPSTGLATGSTTGLATGSAARLDPVSSWNQQALAAVKTARSSDADAARAYAIANIAVYDAVNGIMSQHSFPRRSFALKSPDGAPRFGDPSAAAVEAAYTTLAGLYPDQLARFDAQRAADLAQLGQGPAVTAGLAWGHTVGTFVLSSRAADGYRPVETQPAGDGPGVFRAGWSGTQYRNLRPFAIADAGRYVPPAPPALTSLDYAAAFADVALVGDASIAAPEKLAFYQYWSLGTGSVQPPGEWIRIGIAVTSSRQIALADKARLFALLTMSMADASIPTARAKFAYRHWRPETAIQQADTDGNPHTAPNPAWKARSGSPGGTPEYISGHSSFSSAGATALAGFFCDDLIPFTHVSDTAPLDPVTSQPMSRSFAGFSAAAADAGRSRVVGGTHFEFSNQAGLAVGGQVATEVLAGKLLYTTGPTHFGRCPR